MKVLFWDAVMDWLWGLWFPFYKAYCRVRYYRHQKRARAAMRGEWIPVKYMLRSELVMAKADGYYDDAILIRGRDGIFYTPEGVRAEIQPTHWHYKFADRWVANAAIGTFKRIGWKAMPPEAAPVIFLHSPVPA